MTRTLVCIGCGRNVDYCAFCEVEECAERICFRCLLYELDEARPVAPRDES